MNIWNSLRTFLHLNKILSCIHANNFLNIYKNLTLFPLITFVYSYLKNNDFFIVLFRLNAAPPAPPRNTPPPPPQSSFNQPINQPQYNSGGEVSDADAPPYKMCVQATLTVTNLGLISTLTLYLSLSIYIHKLICVCFSFFFLFRLFWFSFFSFAPSSSLSLSLFWHTQAYRWWWQLPACWV